MNTYPLIISRNLIFDSKEHYINQYIYSITASLKNLEYISEDSVYYALETIDTGSLSSVIVTDNSGDVIYAVENDSYGNSIAAVQEDISTALTGYDTIECSFKDQIFVSQAASPVIIGGNIAGAVHIAEYDSQQGAILINLQTNLRTISLVIAVLSVALSMFFTETLTKRIRGILSAISAVREGNYGYRLQIKGKDELSGLGNEFNRLTDRLQITEEVRRRFVSDASHELKTPLASIKLLSDSILQNKSIMDSETMLEFVDDIQGEAERLTRTTEKLLSLTRLDSRITSQKTILDVATSAYGALNIVRPIAASRGIEIVCDFEENCCVMAAEDDLYQIMINICENAVKYNRENGKVFITIKGEGSDVLYSVRDTGIGVPKESLEHIFDRFYRVDTARSREAGGSGLGLSIVKSMVAECGGKVTAENAEEGGMIFTVSLPRVIKKD